MTPLSRRRFSELGRGRPRAVWAAFITATIVSFLVVVGVLLPVLTLIGAADGATAGVLDVPVGQIALAIVIGYMLGLALLLGTARSRSGALAWVFGVAAVVSTLLVSLWPLLAVAIAGAGQAQDVVPFLRRLITTALQR